jgi:hypothetical protein
MKLWQLLPVVAILAPLFASVGLLWLWIQLTGWSGRRNPLTQDLLRSPGESLREQREDNSWDLATYFGMSSFPILAAYGYYMSYLAFEGNLPGIGPTVFL